MPLLVAVWQSKITVRYNTTEEGTAGVEQNLENSAFSVHCSLLTAEVVELEQRISALEERAKPGRS